MSGEDEWARVFKLHDARYEHTLPKEEIMHCARSCGILMTNGQLKVALQSFPERMTYPMFVEAMRKLQNDAPKEKELLNALRAFDTRETGDLSRTDVAGMLTMMNDKITSVELERVLRGLTFSHGDDRVKIDALFQHLTRGYKGMFTTPSEIRAALGT